MDETDDRNVARWSSLPPGAGAAAESTGEVELAAGVPGTDDEAGCTGCTLRTWLFPGAAPGISPSMGRIRETAVRGGHCPGNQERSCIVEETIATVLTTMEMDEVVDRTARLLRRHFGSTRVGLFCLVPELPGEAEVLRVDDPLHPVPEPGTRFPLEGTAAGLAVASGRVQVLEALDPSRPRVREEAVLGEYGYGALACFPLSSEGRVLGVLEIAHPPRCGMLERCVEVAERVAQLIAIALANSQLLSEVRRLNGLLERENSYLKDRLLTTDPPGSYVAEGPLMREVIEKVRLVAPSDSTVLIRGETGTGKEGLARLVHEQSLRREGPFVVVNLGAIPETLIESELFGHEKGAFTGASRRKLGRFEQAARGTIFLDEVGDAPLPVQVKLLRALQERRIDRVGGSATIEVDVRVVAATNRPLERMMEEGTFRSDLYYRLSTFPIHLPPLAERPEDLRPLVMHLLQKHAARMHRKPPTIPAAVWHELERHRWPGNIRELENFLERALILCPTGPLILVERPGGALPDGGELRGANAGERPASGDPAESGASGEAVLPFAAEMHRILSGALEATGGRIYGEGGAAALLELKPTTLQGKLRRYGVRRPE